MAREDVLLRHELEKLLVLLRMRVRVFRNHWTGFSIDNIYFLMTV